MEINKRGYWENNSKEGHIFDEDLCTALINFMKDKNIISVVDFGCGPGDYLKQFKKHFDAEGYDGNPYTKNLTNGMASVLDLSKKVRLGRIFDAVICLEVGEHIPRKYEKIFLDNLIRHTGTYIIISWAILGQNGDGHVNCRQNSYIKALISDYGFENLEKEENYLKKKVSFHSPWFRDTLMVFKKLSNNRKANFYHNIANILLNNSDVIIGNKITYRIDFLHLFFLYAQRFEKQHYADFAFELLEENLSHVIKNMPINDDQVLDRIEFAHGIMRYINRDFFESSNLDEIIRPFDEIAIHETKKLSRYEFSSYNLHGLLIVVQYFIERIKHLNEISATYFNIKQHLLIGLFELVHNIKLWNDKDFSGIILLEALLRKCIENEETINLAKKGLHQLEILNYNKLTFKADNECAINWDLNKELLLSIYFSEMKKDIFKDKNNLRTLIEAQINIDLENLSKHECNNSILSIYRITVYTLILLEGPNHKDILFYLQAIIKLLNQK